LRNGPIRAHLSLGRFFGVQVGLHLSWALIALLITLSLGQHFQATNAQWGAAVVWAAAVVTAALFFLAIVLHELSHALVARARGVPVRRITLFALGGVAEMEKDAEDARTEFWVGLVGPLTSAALGAVCIGLAHLLGADAAAPGLQGPGAAILIWLGLINLSLAVFNLIPGFPLDGGRILRAALWWYTGDRVRATRVAARAGQAVALGMILLGVVRFFAGAGLPGLWIAFIGWFLLGASGASYLELQVAEKLKGLRVADVMADDCPLVDGWLNLESFVDGHLLRTGRRCFFVVEQGRVAGLVTLHEVKRVPRPRWRYATLSDVMRPLESLRTVSPDTPVSEAIERMAREDVHQLPVVSNGHLDGVLSRANILRFLETRADLGI
jgi:Zn-dependent protease/CBS domain-containing protein